MMVGDKSSGKMISSEPKEEEFFVDEEDAKAAKKREQTRERTRHLEWCRAVIFEEGNHGASQPSQLSALTANIKDARPSLALDSIIPGGKENQSVHKHGGTGIKRHKKDNIDVHRDSDANSNVRASDLVGDEDENWLHRNDNWRPRVTYAFNISTFCRVFKGV
ncbi:hypothetical protein EJB05_14900 [Eragrostis curvula]|uniref:Uncharacterized protein n=1 Tax=Eragrostis curvula TaxID=38414 RepID=A0A5J9VZR3_9POAL|nr:hypothetical protein EJB05_14900 [Eragrostis curvula]